MPTFNSIGWILRGRPGRSPGDNLDLSIPLDGFFLITRVTVNTPQSFNSIGWILAQLIAVVTEPAFCYLSIPLDGFLIYIIVNAQRRDRYAFNSIGWLHTSPVRPLDYCVVPFNSIGWIPS